MAERAWILDCWDQLLGGYLAEPAVAGATTLVLQNAADFDAAGGVVQIDDTFYEYGSSDLDENTLTLGDPLEDDLDVDEFVQAWDPMYDSPRMDVRASVEIVGHDESIASNAVSVIVSTALADRLPRGGRGGVRGEVVLLEDYNSTYRVVDILGKELSTDGGYLKTDTVQGDALDPTAIDGMTGVGTTVKTSEEGERIEFDSASGLNRVRFFTGDDLETQEGLITVDSELDGSQQFGYLNLSSPILGDGGFAALLSLVARANSDGSAGTAYVSVRSPVLYVSNVDGEDRIVLNGENGDVDVEGILSQRDGWQVPLIRFGDAIATTGPAGVASFSFGATFPAGPVVVIAAGGNDEDVYVNPASVSSTGFTCRFRDRGASNAPLADTVVRLFWIALHA